MIIIEPNNCFGPRMLWYGREWGVTSPSRTALIWPRAYNHCQGSLTAFSRHYCYLQDWEDRKWMSGALTGSVDTENPFRIVRKSWLQTNGVHGLQDFKGINGVWTTCWWPITIWLHLLTFLHCLVDWTFRSKARGVAP